MSWHLIVERKLNEAFAEGLFDNLPGVGKPFASDDDALVPVSWRVAFHLLKRSDLAPAWILMDADIRKDRDSARLAFACAALHLEEHDPEYTRAVQVFAQRLAQINESIDELNLRIPTAQLARPRLNPNREIEHIRCGSVAGRPAEMANTGRPELSDSNFAQAFNASILPRTGR